MLESKNFILARHGQAHANINFLTCGLLDSHLTPMGSLQAHELGQSLYLLQSQSFDVIVHSGLARSRQTAEIVSRYFPHLQLVERNQLNERSFGLWEGYPWQEIITQLNLGITPPKGEKKDDFISRIEIEIGHILANLSNSPIIIGHGGTFYALGCLFGYQSLNIENCAAYYFKQEKGAWINYRIRNGQMHCETPFL